LGKTSEANLEFSYDSGIRAEVAPEPRNIVNFHTTVFTDVGHERPLFLETKQYAAAQLALSFLFDSR
jgi:hypothetical protein